MDYLNNTCRTNFCHIKNWHTWGIDSPFLKWQSLLAQQTEKKTLHNLLTSYQSSLFTNSGALGLRPSGQALDPMRPHWSPSSTPYSLNDVSCQTFISWYMTSQSSTLNYYTLRLPFCRYLCSTKQYGILYIIKNVRQQCIKHWDFPLCTNPALLPAKSGFVSYIMTSKSSKHNSFTYHFV